MRAATFFAVALLYVGAGVFDHEIWAPVEPTVAGVVWEMVDSGDLLLPRINGIPFVEKPPFYHWLAVGVSRVTGSLEAWTMRLPAALLGMACLALLYASARREFGERAARVAVLLGATHLLFWHASHWASSDIAAVFFCFLCFAIFAGSLAADVTPGGRRRRDLALCVALAMSFYAKNLYVPFVVLPTLTVFLILRRDPLRAVRIAVLAGVLLPAAMIPWLLHLHREGGELLLKVVLHDNTLGRLIELRGVEPSLAGFGNFNDALGAEPEPFWFYASVLPLYVAPWPGVFVVALTGLLRKRRRLCELQRFALVGAVTLPILLSLPRSKSLDYLLPLSFFVFLILADLLADLFRGRRLLARWERLLIGLNFAVLLALLVAFPIAIVAILGGAPLLLLLAPCGLIAAWQVRLLWGRGVDAERIAQFAAYGAVVGAVGLAVTLAKLDPLMSYRPFFEDLAPHRDGRRFVTTYLGVNRLPLITYYLRSRVEIVDGPAAVVARLRGSGPVGAVIRREECADVGDALRAIPGVVFTDAHGRGRLCSAVNRVREAAPEKGAMPLAPRG
jgi:4-amino-4-deoxy-L-arabinose transferase-like glycosyltransferase